MSVTLCLWSLLVAIVIALLLLVRRRFTFWAKRGVDGPKSFEFEGVFEKWIDFATRHRQKYGRIFGAYLIFNNWLIINEPDLIRDIMTKDFHIFADRYHMNLGKTNLSKALFFMNGNEDWKRIRSIVTPAFTSGKLKVMMSSISDLADKFVLNLDDFAQSNKPIDMRKYLGAFAMDVISTCAYGINPESINNPNNPIVVNAKKILAVDSSLSYILSVLAPPIGRLFKLEPFNRSAIGFFDDLTKRIVTERKNAPKTVKRSDFIQLMIDNEESDPNIASDQQSDKSKKSGHSLTNDELTAQGILFFIAGYDTTSAALSHAIYFLAQNKSCQQRLAEELTTLPEEFTYENLNELKYLNAVINETLRLKPPLLCIQRECTQDYKLGDTGITIPAGTTIEIGPYIIHRDPEFFPDPDQFKPERFINPQHHPYAFIPFGGGPRLCVGMRFALNEMRMCIAKLIHRYEFVARPDTKLDYFKGSILLTPKEVLLDIKRRNTSL